MLKYALATGADHEQHGAGGLMGRRHRQPAGGLSNLCLRAPQECAGRLSFATKLIEHVRTSQSVLNRFELHCQRRRGPLARC